MVPRAIYLYFTFFSTKLSKKYVRAAIVQESVMNCFGTAWNKAYKTKKNPSIRYRFLMRSVSICNSDFFQSMILEETREIRAKEKLTSLIDFEEIRYVIMIKKKKAIHHYN